MAFIEERLFWLGEISRAEIVRRFDVSMSQASNDLGQYTALNPEGVRYDLSAKRYVAQASFRTVLSRPDAGSFLGELRLLEAGLISVEQTIGGIAPSFDATPIPERQIDPFILRTIVQAMRNGLAVDARYQSMSRPEPTRRVIEPHALVYDGFRWHTRAFDRETGEFRDFVFGRISKAKHAGNRASSQADDADWNTRVGLRIGPHPGLTSAQASAVALDYGIDGPGGATITVRRALLYYALKRLGLDLDPTIRPPNVQQIVLLNRDELPSSAHRGVPAT